MVLPFISLGVGIAIGLLDFPSKILKIFGNISNVALILLMVTIGMNVGTNDMIMDNLPKIGVDCFVIAFFAVGFSVLLVLILEKTVLPLEEISKSLSIEEAEVDIDSESRLIDPIVLSMLFGVIIGVVVGFYLLPKKFIVFLDYMLEFSLVILYVGVGISQGANRAVFKYLKVIGFKVLLLPIAIFFGSVIGGFFTAFLLKIPNYISVISSSGMSYYSVTGVYMSKVFGTEIGIYGFLANIMREIITILFLPVLFKLSKGSPIAGGAAGNMDTMLAPITKFVGVEYGLITLITGVILTFFVPIILPIWYKILF